MPPKCPFYFFRSNKGIHKALWHLDYTLDIARLDEEGEDEDWSRYKIIYLPFSPFVSSQAAAKLKAYVKRGGTLVAEASLAQFDDAMGVCPVVPGQGLDELFGCRRMDVRTMPAEKLPRLEIGPWRIKNRMHKEILTPLGNAQAIGAFNPAGETAAVENRFGKGRAIYLGSNPFMSYAADGDPQVLEWIKELNANAKRHCWTDKSDVCARMLIRGESRLVFLLNTSPNPAEVTLTIAPGNGKPPAHAMEITKATRTEVSKQRDGPGIKEKLEPYGTRVYLIE